MSRLIKSERNKIIHEINHNVTYAAEKYYTKVFVHSKLVESIGQTLCLQFLISRFYSNSF